MSDVPFDVLLKGPAAVAAYLDHERQREEHTLLQSTTYMVEILRTVRLDPRRPEAKVTHDNTTAAMTAILTVAALLAYAGADCMRGRARDNVAELIDLAFDTVEASQAESGAISQIIAQILREAKK